VTSRPEPDRLLKELRAEGERVQRSGRTILRALRVDAGLTRAQMAEKLGVPEETVRDLETGRRQIRLEDPPLWAIVTENDPVRAIQQIYSWKELSKGPRRT
jgi:DNA-binding XRE family transcriptional regulator